MEGIEGWETVGSGRGEELPTRRARKPGRVTVIASANTGESRAGSPEQGERRLTDSDDNNPVTQDKANLKRREWLETGCERPWLQLMCCAVTPSGGLTSRQASEDELPRRPRFGDED